MIQAGAAPKAVRSIVGHRSAAFTLSVYGHVFDADVDDLAARARLVAKLPRCCPAGHDPRAGSR